MALALFPLAITVMFSFKGIHDFDRGFWTLPSTIYWSNYSYGFSRVLTNMANSVCVGVIVSLVVVALSSFVAHVFTQRDFYGKKRPVFPDHRADDGSGHSCNDAALSSHTGSGLEKLLVCADASLDQRKSSRSDLSVPYF